MTDESTLKELKKNIDRLEKDLGRERELGRDYQEREKELRRLIDYAVVGIFRTTEKGELLLINQKFAQMFGFESPKGCLSSVSNVTVLYENHDDRQLILKELKSSGFFESSEVRLRRRNGEPFWASLRSRAIKRKDGETVLEGFVIDISDRKRSEEELKSSEKRFRAMVEQAGDAFWNVDYDGKILDVNRLSCEILGYSREELLRMKISDVDIEAKEKQHKARYWEPLEPGQHITFEGVHRRKDGTTFPVEVRVSRVDFGDQRCVLGLTRDITERKQGENRLRKAFDEINELKNLLELENIYLREQIEAKYRHEDIVGKSPAIQKVLKAAEKVAKGNTCVLILGETGTGKELLARAIHNMSPRKKRSMINVNCSALPSTLIEGELFGREKGAFTGAVSRQIGRFEMANGSTIFLDEIGDLALELQPKLLRVLEDGTFERIGSSETIYADARVIAATNHDLQKLVKEKRFRSDLYYRVNVFPISLPPLRERREDIPLLVRAFVEEFSKALSKPIKHISKETIDLLQDYSWPGNVRELRNSVERAVIMSTDSTLRIDWLVTDELPATEDVTMDEMQRKHILQVLNKTRWRIRGKNGAAAILEMKPTTLEGRMKKLGIRRNG